MKNLINNAIKYRREDVPLKIQVETSKAEAFVLLTVKDNGTGINLEKFKTQLFTPFKRFTTKNTEGTGIGLFIIKTIIEKNGGSVTVESTPGQGTTFYCYLKEYSKCK